MTLPTKHALASVALVGLLALSGCGDDTEPTASDVPSSPGGSDTPSETVSETGGATASPDPAEPELPSCEETWSAERLPAKYLGCMDGDTLVEAEAFTCSSGQRLVTYTNHYAVAGRTITTTDGEVTDDPGYRQAVQACTA